MPTSPSDDAKAPDLLTLLGEIAELRERLEKVEQRAETAEREAATAKEEILEFKDQLAAAERDQQDLRTTRARLERVRLRGLLARVLNKH